MSSLSTVGLRIKWIVFSFNFFQSSLTKKVSQQEVVFNNTMIEKAQTINEKFDEHEQKLQNIVSVNLHSFCTKFNSILIELYIGRQYFSPEILCWSKRRIHSNPRWLFSKFRLTFCWNQIVQAALATRLWS